MEESESILPALTITSQLILGKTEMEAELKKSMSPSSGDTTKFNNNISANPS